MDVSQSIFSIIFMVEFIVGNIGNGFIALVNCVDWIKRRNISALSQILIALAISRIGFLWLVLLNWWASVFYSDLLTTGNIIRMIYITWTVISHFSNWLATCLSIFYFLKIANFTNSFFLYLKWRVREMVLVTLLSSLILLFLNIIIKNTHIDIWIDGTKRNTSDIKFSKFLLFPNLMFNFIPFTVTLAVFLLLIFSLWKHLKNMWHNAHRSGHVNTTAHIKALQTVVAFLLLYTIYLLSILTQVWKFEFLDEDLIIFFGQSVVLAFPSGHSCILILVDSKLQQTFLSVMWWLRCYSPQMWIPYIHKTFGGLFCVF
uniref:Taste receptor type 2 n=1 Tax=Nannospalax galili TaxID=1026970 RepID=A0A7S5W9I9_NANGA|nr:taste receptor type 2 member 586 [Nannospalax galili]QKE46545.1 taste receptor type 2 member 586 [Nannospalax galili]